MGMGGRTEHTAAAAIRLAAQNQGSCLIAARSTAEASFGGATAAAARCAARPRAHSGVRDNAFSAAGCNTSHDWQLHRHRSTFFSGSRRLFRPRDHSGALLIVEGGDLLIAVDGKGLVLSSGFAFRHGADLRTPSSVPFLEGPRSHGFDISIALVHSHLQALDSNARTLDLYRMSRVKRDPKYNSIAFRKVSTQEG